MRKGNDIDKIFKSGLGEMQLNPPEYVWDNIDSALGEKKDRNALWLWLFGLLLIGGGIVGTYTYLYNVPENANMSGVLVDDSEKEDNIAIGNRVNTEGKEVENGEDSVIKMENENQKAVTNEGSNIKKNKIDTKIITNFSGDKIVNVKENNVLELNTTLSNQENVDILPNTIQQNLEKSNKFIKTVINKNSSSSNKHVKENKNILLEESKNIKKQRTLFNILPLESINNGLTYESEDVEASDDFIQRNTECYSFAQRGSGRVALEIYGGPAVSLKSLRDVTGESLYLTRRNETESARVAMNAGFKVEFGIKPNLSVKTGINYTLLNERFDYQNTMEERITIIYVRDMNGVIIDSTLTREFGTREKTTYNRYHLIDIPILISYSVSTKSLSMALNAGALVNLYFGQKGDIIEPVSTLMPTSITTGESIYPVFKNNVGVSLYAGLSVYYPIRKSIDLVFEPNVRHILRPVTLDVHPIEQSYTVFGANLGLRFRFN